MEFFRLTLGEMIAPCRLDGAFQRFGTRIGEEHLVGERGFRQAAAEAFLAGHFIQVRQVPDLVSLCFQCRDKMRMRMTERIDRDTGGKIQITGAILGNQPDAFAALEPQGCACIRVIKRRGIGHGACLLKPSRQLYNRRRQQGCDQPVKNQNAALRRPAHYLHFAVQCQQKPMISGNSR